MKAAVPSARAVSASMKAVLASFWDVTTSMPIVAGTMKAIAGAMWDVAASMQAVTYSVCSVQVLCGLSNKTKIPDSDKVKAFQVEVKKRKKRKIVHPVSEIRQKVRKIF